ncbi:unnamed protein product, partial [Effrenium voratum]
VLHWMPITAAGLAVGLTAAAQELAGAVFPAGGAIALVFVVSPQRSPIWSSVLYTGLLSASLLVIFGTLLNNLQETRRFPRRWPWQRGGTAPHSFLPPLARPRQSERNLVRRWMELERGSSQYSHVYVGVLTVALQCFFLIFLFFAEVDMSMETITSMCNSLAWASMLVLAGFGYMQSFLKAYGLGAVGYSMLITSLAVQWSMILESLLDLKPLHFGFSSLVQGYSAAAAVLISFGALIGKVDLLQILALVVLELPCYCWNKVVFLQLTAGNKPVVHDAGGLEVFLFGAFFGLAAARVLGPAEMSWLNRSQRSSELLALLGTACFWACLPCFVAAHAKRVDTKPHAWLNTVLALLGSTVAAFGVDPLLEDGRLEPAATRGAALAGGVAISVVAGEVEPFIALAVGCLSGGMATCGLRFASRELDTCGVLFVHGLPAVLGGLVSVLVPILGGDSGISAGNQAFGLCGTLLLASLCGACCGQLLRSLHSVQLGFSDELRWACSEETNGTQRPEECPQRERFSAGKDAGWSGAILDQCSLPDTEAEGRRAKRRRRAREEEEVEEPLHFDLPRRLTKQERQEVREELSTALSALSEVQAVPKRAQEIAPAELRLRTKVPLISTELRVGAGPVELARVLQLLMEAFDAAELELKERGRFISGEYRQMLVEDQGEAGVAAALRRAASLRRVLAPEALAASARLCLVLRGPALALGEVMLEALIPHVAGLPDKELAKVLASANAVGGLPAASKLLGALLQRLAERVPSLEEEELYGALEVLGGHVGEVDPVTLEDFIESLRPFWVLWGSRTLIKALLSLGQASALDVKSCRALLEQLEARSDFIGSKDREALLLLLALHKSAFDRSTAALGLPHPLYDEAAKRLVKALSRDAAAKMSTVPMQSLSRPVLALAELRTLDHRALQVLTERLKSGRLLSLSPTAFVSLAYAHRLVRGPVPLEPLRRPMCLAFGALLHAMEPKQVASCVESLKGYSYKAFGHVFQAAYVRLARALEEQAQGIGCEHPWAMLTPAEAAAAVRSFPELKFEEPDLLVRTLQALTEDRRLLTSRDDALSREFEEQSMLQRMTMVELVDVMEAFGQQGCKGNAVAQAIAGRYRANGGRISRRNTARAIQTLAMLEADSELLELLIGELEGWQVSDPDGSELRPRPAVGALWALCALQQVPRTAQLIDWLLSFLCRESVVSLVLATKSQALLLFESLCAVQTDAPAIAARHLEALSAVHSTVAEQVLFDVGAPLRGAAELLALPSSTHRQLHTGHGEEPALGALEGELPSTMPGRSMLDELAVHWEMHRHGKERHLSKAKELLGAVLAALSCAPVLRKAAHPLGPAAGEATRGTGGFELQWPVGCYDVDWGHPFFRIGVLVLSPKDFLQDPGSTALRAAARLRLRQLEERGWQLTLLRSSEVESSLLPWQQDPQVFNHRLQARVARANKMYPLEQRQLLRQLQQISSEEREEEWQGLQDLLVEQLQRQLDFVFPDALLAGMSRIPARAEKGRGVRSLQ